MISSRGKYRIPTTVQIETRNVDTILSLLMRYVVPQNTKQPSSDRELTKRKRIKNENENENKNAYTDPYLKNKTTTTIDSTVMATTMTTIMTKFDRQRSERYSK